MFHTKCERLLNIALLCACVVVPAHASNCGSLQGCFLRNFDAPDARDIALVGDVPSYSIGAHDSFSIRCDVQNGTAVDFVRFQYDDQVHTEYRAPYWMNGDVPGWIHRTDYLGSTCPERKSIQVTGFLWGETEACFDETFELFAECDGFDITLSLVDMDDGTPFTDAAERWSEIITGDLPPVIGFENFVQPFEGCPFPRDVDDMEICGLFRPIDGPAMAVTGPDYLRAESNLPINGLMVIDPGAAVLESEMRKTILREMGHVLGIGTLWGMLGVATLEEAGCAYNGTRASMEYERISGCDSGLVPIESGGGSSEVCTHWAHSCFTSELMTPISSTYDQSPPSPALTKIRFADTGDFEPLSQITAASLEDLGYEVSFEKVDSIMATDLSPSCRCGRQARRLSGWKQISDDKPRRRLSAATEVEARESAHRFLKSRSVDESLLPENVRYVGDKVVIVFVEQDDIMYNVVVTK